MATVAITGVTGLAGGRVAQALCAAGYRVIGISRRPAARQDGPAIRTVPDLTSAALLMPVLQGCDAVFHFADRADRKSYGEDDVATAAAVLTAIREACAAGGVRRIVAASSIHADRPDRPDDRYGRSKRAMEAAGLAAAPGVPAVVLRLPPLHGPGARGAVRHIARATARGWPLPFGLAEASRRFLSLDALADLCVHLVALDNATFVRAAGRIWVPVNVRQGNLAALTRSIAHDKAWLVPVPGIDRLIGGRVSPEQLEQDWQDLFRVVGWEARD